jgi:uncharacterized protein YjbI with pentapeptide repeats
MAIQSKMSDRRTKSANRRIDSFEKNFGKPHLYLAYHAAFPLSLTPDLLYRLWSKFQQDVRGDSLEIPWCAVADLLLSNLCEAVGHELYEMDQTVRAELLRRLKSDPDFNIPDSDRNRIGQLADFLLEYVEQQLHSDDPDAQAFAQAQQWLALAYARPGKAVEQIAQILRKMQSSRKLTSANEPELLRLASLVETLAEPLVEAGLEPLLVYFQGIESLARGDLEQAKTELASIAASGKIEIGGEELPVPDSIRAKWNLSEQPVGANFSKRKLCGRSFKDQDLTGANFSNTDLRGANFIGAKLTGANFSNARMGMQRRWAMGLMFCCFLLALFTGIGISLVSLGFSSSLTYLAKGTAASFTTEFSWRVFNDLLRWSSLSFLVELTGIYIISKGKSLQTSWKFWTLAFMFSPICLTIATFLAGYLIDLNSISNITIVISDIVSAILFGILSCLIIWRGLRAKWVASALAWVGFPYMGVVVLFMLFSLLASWSSIVKSPLSFVLSTLMMGCILLPFIVFQTLISRRSKIATLQISTSIGLGIGLVLFIWLPSQSEVIKTFFISIASAANIILLVLAFPWQGSRSQTLAGIFIKGSGSILIVTVFSITVTWFMSKNSLLLALPGSSISKILSIGIGVFLVVAISLAFTIIPILAGFLSFRAAILGIFLMIAPVGISLCLSWINSLNSNLIPSNVTMALALASIFLTGMMLALSCAITMGLFIAIVWAECGNRRIAIVWSSTLILTPIIATVVGAMIAGWGSVVIAGTIISALAIVQLGLYLGRQAISGDPKFAAIRQSALSIAALSGTNFWGADLSEANFTQATLKSANFKQAKLTHTKWFRVRKLDLAYFGDSYLQYPQIQKILATGMTQEQNFDGLDLQGINLRRANLTSASFVGTNLQGADLRQANLSGARLINTQIDGANLSGATLTGIYYQNCKYSETTVLEAVECEYIYTGSNDSTSGTSAPNRKTHFRPGEFANFVSQ